MIKTFYLPPKDRVGFFILIILFLIISASATLYQNVFALNESDKLALIEEALTEHNQVVQAQVRETLELKDEAEILTPKALGTFDPNVASKEVLMEQGFSQHAANNLTKYRAAGGEIKKSSDLYKIYGLDTGTIIQMKDRLILPQPKNEPKIKREKFDTPNQASIAPVIVEKEVVKEALQLETFDPNTASQEELEKYGLSSYAAKNLIKYISKGGELRKPEDLKKVYGVDNNTYTKALPYIKIEKSNLEESDKLESPSTHATTEEESSREKEEKEIISLNINVATPEELIKISGIGPVISKGIVEYRERLGGYHDLTQLKEVYGVSEESYDTISKYLFVEGEVKRFYIPGTKFKQVLRHPYIDYETTKIVKGISIMNYARDFQKLIEEGTIDQRLLPYIHLLDPDLE